MVEGIDPQLDEDGYPTNPAYFEALGFDPVAANRQIVDLQATRQEYEQLLQILSDPQARAQFLAQFDQQMQQPNRPQMPGQNPYNQYSSDPAQLFRAAIDYGNPVDQFDQVAALWSQVPAEFIIQEALRTFPDVD